VGCMQAPAYARHSCEHTKETTSPAASFFEWTMTRKLQQTKLARYKLLVTTGVL